VISSAALGNFFDFLLWMTSRILDSDWTYSALAFVCLSLFVILSLCFGSRVLDYADHAVMQLFNRRLVSYRISYGRIIGKSTKRAIVVRGKLPVAHRVISLIYDTIVRYRLSLA